MAMNEREITLVTYAKEGNSKAFEELYSIYYGKILALARMTVKNEADAEDILQQAFINAWQNLPKLTNPAAFNTWLQKITLNMCYSQLRKKNIAILMDIENESDDYTDEPSDELLPAIYAERDDLRHRLGKIIDSLSDVQKQTIVLYYFNEQKVEEIAYIMDCNAGTVKKRLFLARKAIRTEIEEEERKSGEKFYGIAGLPMLPLADMLNQHIQSQVIATDVFASSLNAITEAISQDIAFSAESATGASAVPGAATEATMTTPTGISTASTATGLTTSVKAAIVAAVAVLGIGLGFGGTVMVNSIRADNETPQSIEDSASINTPENILAPDETAQTTTPESTPAPSLDSNTNADVAPAGNKIVSVYTTGGHLFIGLREDGTVIGSGPNRNVEGWTDITSIFLTLGGTFGVKSNGTVVFTGENSEIVNNAIAGLTDIASVVSANIVESNAVICVLKKDGTVAFTTYYPNMTDADISFLSGLTDVIDLQYPYALKADGTVACIYPGKSQILDNVSDIIAISASSLDYAIGLKANGTVVSFGKVGQHGPPPAPGSDQPPTPHTFQPIPGHQEKFAEWHDIVKIAAVRLGSFGNSHYGIRSDGTVVFSEDRVPSFVAEALAWTDIVDISAGDLSVIGVTSDGQIFVATSDTFGANQNTVDEVLSWR